MDNSREWNPIVREVTGDYSDSIEYHLCHHDFHEHPIYYKRDNKFLKNLAVNVVEGKELSSLSINDSGMIFKVFPILTLRRFYPFLRAQCDEDEIIISIDPISSVVVNFHITSLHGDTTKNSSGLAINGYPILWNCGMLDKEDTAKLEYYIGKYLGFREGFIND